MATDWDKMNGIFNYQGVLITKRGPGDYLVFGEQAKSFGECVIKIKEACQGLEKSIQK